MWEFVTIRAHRGLVLRIFTSREVGPSLLVLGPHYWQITSLQGPNTQGKGPNITSHRSWFYYYYAQVGPTFTTGRHLKQSLKVPKLAQKGPILAYFRVFLGVFGLFLGVSAQICEFLFHFQFFLVLGLHFLFLSVFQWKLEIPTDCARIQCICNKYQMSVLKLVLSVLKLPVSQV